MLHGESDRSLLIIIQLEPVIKSAILDVQKASIVFCLDVEILAFPEEISLNQVILVDRLESAHVDLVYQFQSTNVQDPHPVHLVTAIVVIH